MSIKLRIINLAFILFASLFFLSEVFSLPSKVEVKQRQLIVSKRLADESLDLAKPYSIKGITWSPSTISPDKGENPLNTSEEIQYGFFYNWPERVPQGHEILLYWKKKEYHNFYKIDSELMAQLNVNTVRVYNDFGDMPEIYNAILDELYSKGIMVIMGIANGKEDFDNESYLQIVNAYKNHPAILMWCIGNEWNVNKYYGNYEIADLVVLVNNAAGKIKSLDPNHPISTSLGDNFDDSNPSNRIDYIVVNCPNIDVFGFNMYRGESFGDLFNRWSRITQKPLYLGEFGIDSFFTTEYTPDYKQPWIAVQCQGADDDYSQSLQAQYFFNLWQEIKDNLSALNANKVCLGGCVHELNDELWKVGCYHAGLGNIYDPVYAKKDYKYYNKEGGIQYAFPDEVSNEEYYGVVDATREKKKKVFWDIQDCYFLLE